MDKRVDYSLLNKIVFSKDFFLLGEAHNISCNPKIAFDLFTYLNSQNKLRNIVIEFGYAEAWLYNQYITNGDTTFLAGTLYANYNEYNLFWKSIKEFNQTLNAKVQIIGVDFERPKAVKKVFNCLYDTLLLKNKPKDLSNFLNFINQYVLRKDSTIKEQYAEMRLFLDSVTLYLQNKDIALHLGSKHTKLLQNISTNKVPIWLLMPEDEGEQLVYTQKNMPIREREMYNNLCQQVHRKEKYLGLFGYAHTTLNWDICLAYLLRNSKKSPMKDKVVSLNMHYENCYTDDKKVVIESFLHDDLLELPEIEKFKKQLINHCEIQLIRLDKKDKIQKKIYLSGQFLFFIRNQQAIQKIK
jgi:hypothetical protein